MGGKPWGGFALRQAPTLRLDTPGSQEASLAREGVYKGLSSLGRREGKRGGTGLFVAAFEHLDIKRGGD